MSKDPARERELEMLRAELARRRAEWVLRIAPNARESESPPGWRLGDISGAAGKSLLIYRDPEHRTHVDFNGEQWKGDDLDLIRALCRAPDFPSTIERAADLIGFRLEGRAEAKRKKPTVTATGIFEYCDENGAVRFEVVREDRTDGTKRIYQRRRNASGRVVHNLDGIEAIPYRLPELIKGIEAGAGIFIVEGERKVGVLMRWGLVATCNAGGAGKWRVEHAEPFKRRRVPVVILPDHDQAGEKHARQVAENLAPWAESIKVVQLPRLGPKEDVVDWAARGGTKELLLAFVEETPPWGPADARPESKESESATDADADGAGGDDIDGVAGDDATLDDQPASSEAASEVEENRAPAFSEEALALDFAAKHAAELRYVAFWSLWLLWTGRRWRHEETLRAFDLARAICRQAAIGCDKPKVRSILASARTVASIERLSRADRRLAATVDQWDRDPWSLNMEVERGNR